MSNNNEETAKSIPIEKKTKKHWNIHPYSIIFSIILIAAILTWIIPAGQFDRVSDEATGREIAVAGTYHLVEQNQIDPVEMVLLIVSNMAGAGDMIIFILIIGGAFGVLTATGAIDTMLVSLIKAFHGKPYSRFLFPVIMLFLFFCASTFGMGEEGIILTPLLVAAAIALGYDAVVAVAVMVLSIALGYASATTNPYNIGIAQSIAGLPMYSGLWFRVIIFVILYGIAAWYVLRYAKKIKKDPSKSLVADIDYSDVKIHEDPSKIKNDRKT